MASVLNVFYQIFSLHCSSEELEEKFASSYKLALVGSQANVDFMLECLGDSVTNFGNVGLQSEISCFPLPNPREPEQGRLKNVDVAIVHLGNQIPSLSYLRFCRESFPAQAKVIFLTGSSIIGDSGLLSSFAADNHCEQAMPSDEEACRLAEEALNKVRESALETESSGQVVPAWQAAPGASWSELEEQEQALLATELELINEEKEAEKADKAELELKATVANSAADKQSQELKELRLGPCWNSSSPLSSYIVSHLDLNSCELSPRFDPTLPSLGILRNGCEAADFYAYLSKTLDGWVYTLARDYRSMRENIVSIMIKSAAKDCAAAAVASGSFTALPIIGPFIGLFAVSGETIYITARQLRLALLIGAIYGRPINFTERISELIPVVGGAWGWRLLAREAVGFVPVLGSAAKAVVAWSGTYTVGRLSQHFYQTGTAAENDYKEQIVKEADLLAKQAASDVLKSKQ
ncbi:MAG: hypothetical protein ACI376_04625 [Candidatus Bruticola sp.]